MASIFRRGKIWWINYTTNGKRVMKSLKTRSKRLAEQAQIEVERRIAYRNIKQVIYELPEKSEACQVCGYNLVLEEHHFIPRSQGGSDSPANKVRLCPNHHRLLHLALQVLNNNKRNNVKELKNRLERILKVDEDFALFYQRNAAQFEKMKRI